MKRMVAFLVTLSLLLCMLPTAFAADSGTNTAAETAANRLYSLGLMNGSGTNADGSPNFDLDGNLTREQAVVMLLRLLGKEDDAMAAGMEMPFTDVSSWAADCVAYAYHTGLVNGTGTATFHGTREMSAAEYITLVLRVLGYSSQTDFLWSSPWTLSNAIGLTTGEYSSATNRFLRGDMAIISANALDVTLKDGSKTLLEQIGTTPSSERPTKEDYIDPVMTDAQLAALKTASLDTLQKEISTVGDAVKFLDQFTPNAFSGFDGEIRLDLDFVYPLHTSPEATTPQTYTAFAAWCLADDYDGIKYIICTAISGEYYQVFPGLALPVENGFYVYSPQAGSTRANSFILKAKDVSSLNDLSETVSLGANSTIQQIFLADAEQTDLRFIVDEELGLTSVSSGSAQTVYTITEAEKAEQAEAERQQRITYAWSQLKNNWNSYGMPASMAPTMTKEAVESLVGKDLDTVAAACKTLGDCLYYYALSGFTGSGGDLQTRDNSIGGGNLYWHYNYAPTATFARNTGNCGASSGLTSYLLQGDYATVGMIGMTFVEGAGGGHFINYLYDGKQYYVFDIVNLLAAFHQSGFCFSTGSTLKTAANNWVSISENPVRLMWAHQSFDGDVPVGWDWGNSHISYLPAQYKNEAQVLMETPSEGYVYQWVTISDDVQKQIDATRSPFISSPEKDVDVDIDTTGTYMTRTLTDEQLSDLKYADKETLQAWISTVADAVAYLDQFDYTLYDAIDTGFNMDIDFMLNLHRTEATSPDIYTAFTGWCLADDYPETNYLIASVSNPNGPWTHHTLLLPEGNGYRIINPAQHSSHWSCVFGFDEKTLSNLTDLEDKLSPLHSGMGDDSELFIYNLLIAPAGQDKMNFLFDGNYLVSVSGKELYRITDAELDAMAAAEQAAWNEIAKTLNVSNYGIPSAIGTTTLTYEKAYALVGQDPAVIAEQVKTVGDVLQYMIAARFSYDAPPVYTPWYGFWGFDAPGDVQLEQNYGCCCGGFANTVSYLLQGDYDKVGTLRWIGGGNHTISWVYTGGKYYVFDFTQYCNGGYYDYYRAPVTVLDDLADYYDKLPTCYPKNEILLMVAFEAGEAMYPSHWGDPPNFTGLTFPTEAQGKVLTIYQRDDEYGVNYKDITTQIPGWND